LVFRNVKKLKPGRAVPLSGIGIPMGSIVVPLHGSAIMDSAGTIELGITAYSMLDDIPNAMMHAMVDETFTGTIQVDAGGDFMPDGLPAILMGIDCKTVVIP
jgi:hypothetical protein